MTTDHTSLHTIHSSRHAFALIPCVSCSFPCRDKLTKESKEDKAPSSPRDSPRLHRKSLRRTKETHVDGSTARLDSFVSCAEILVKTKLPNSCPSKRSCPKPTAHHLQNQARHLVPLNVLIVHERHTASAKTVSTQTVVGVA